MRMIVDLRVQSLHNSYVNNKGNTMKNPKLVDLQFEAAKELGATLNSYNSRLYEIEKDYSSLAFYSEVIVVLLYIAIYSAIKKDISSDERVLSIKYAKECFDKAFEQAVNCQMENEKWQQKMT